MEASPGDRPTPDFTTDELLAQLEAMLLPEGDGMRTVEVAEELGISTGQALKLIKALDKQGKIEKVRKSFTRFDERMTTTTAYKLIGVAVDELVMSSEG